METTIGDYIGATIGIHSPIPYQALDSRIGVWGLGLRLWRLGFRGWGLGST